MEDFEEYGNSEDSEESGESGESGELVHPRAELVRDHVKGVKRKRQKSVHRIKRQHRLNNAAQFRVP